MSDSKSKGHPVLWLLVLVAVGTCAYLTSQLITTNAQVDQLAKDVEQLQKKFTPTKPGGAPPADPAPSTK